MDLRKKARQLRANMTHEEVKLWLQLKHFNARSLHFRRQAPVDGYVLDFVEFSRKLIIEVDGSQHNEEAAAKRDTLRDEHFAKAGFKIVRFWNFEINYAMDGVIDKIHSLLLDPPPSRPAPPTDETPNVSRLPVKGEDTIG